MTGERYEKTAPGATRSRYRGRLYVALHGPGHAIRGVTVATDFAMACLFLAGEAEGSIMAVPPNEGGPLRKFLAGGPAPLRCPMQARPGRLIAEVARAASVSRRTAQRAVEAVLQDRGGIGAALYGRGCQDAHFCP